MPSLPFPEASGIVQFPEPLTSQFADWSNLYQAFKFSDVIELRGTPLLYSVSIDSVPVVGSALLNIVKFDILASIHWPVACLPSIKLLPVVGDVLGIVAPKVLTVCCVLP